MTSATVRLGEHQAISAQDVPGSAWSRSPGADHFVMEDQAGRVADEVLAFLDDPRA